MSEPLPWYPVFERVQPKDNSLYIIIIVIVVILVIVAAIIIYNVFRPGSNTIGRCEPGLCVVDLGTGEKRCPDTDTEQLTYNIVFEDCTSSNYCQSLKAKCAVLGGGILDCDGVCGPGNEQCRCVKRP